MSLKINKKVYSKLQKFHTTSIRKNKVDDADSQNRTSDFDFHGTNAVQEQKWE